MSLTSERPSALGLTWIFQEFWGFKNPPTITDFEAYGKALLICAGGDGDLASAEREYAIGLIAGMHGPDEVVETLKTYGGEDDLRAVLSNAEGARESGGCLVYDTIRVSAADGVLAPGELDKIHEVADLLSVPRENVAQMVRIHQQEQELRDQRFKLCFPDAANRPFAPVS
ncbi:tellurium resistance protein [Streptomyces ziwulingensis]|uniref:Co-chaperone DjlA N-terminal domain-containing protein n=1 Tax=Streptomyces ziwulingensis TaxID=1045501 RepID=A0ABP9D2Y9_9ACTN